MAKRALFEAIDDEDTSLKGGISRKRSCNDREQRSEKTALIAAEDGDRKLSKAERTAIKKARRTASDGRSAQSIKGPDEVEEAARVARKAARRAERKRQKELCFLGSEQPISSKPSPVPSGTASCHASTQAQVGDSAYSEHDELAQLPQADIDAFLAIHKVTIDDPLPNARRFRPILDFTYLSLNDESQKAPFAKFTAPTPIQAATWPSLLYGRDMIGVAETGSGKTLAFGVPCIHFISSLPKNQRKRLKAVIVSPTRELAVQIYDQLVVLAKPANLQVACVYGGVPKEPQANAVRKAHIVVATPGRLNDLIGDGVADLSQAEYVVLDEADRMLDKGFEEAIRQIISQTSKQRQTLMFTATWPPSVRELASTFMTSPVKITIGDNVSGELRANVRIKQVVEVVDPRAKEQRLVQLLKQYQSGQNKDDRILVFCLYKKEAVRIENFIRMKGFRVGGIHGDLSQEKRSASLAAFKSGQVPLLVATDVAARGLDIPAVKVVINVTFPLTAEDYVHRIGRTGRAGKEGLAVTLFTEHDKGLSGSLINILKAANQPVPDDLLKFGTTVKKKGHDAYGAFYKDVDATKQATKITFD